MFDKNKINGTTGAQVRAFLEAKGVETPMKSPQLRGEEQQKAIEELCKQIMEIQGLDLEDDSLMETPKRWSKVLTKEKFYGLDYNNFPKCTTVINKKPEDADLVLLRDIELHSLCEHHYEPIIGKVQIAYIPGNKILGLSKFNRIVDFFARRPQIQERLTKQIYYALSYLMETEKHCGGN